jgi:hypothetical protein
MPEAPNRAPIFLRTLMHTHSIENRLLLPLLAVPATGHGSRSASPDGWGDLILVPEAVSILIREWFSANVQRGHGPARRRRLKWKRPILKN